MPQQKKTAENQKDKYNFKSDETEKLISLVKERDVLYNLSHPNYHNKDIKENNWAEISKTMKLSGECLP